MNVDYQQDGDGVISCQRRTACPHDLTMHNWCSDREDLCRYDEKCRVPVPTLLSQIAIALEDLMKTSEDMLELILDAGWGRRRVDAIRRDLDAARIMLKHLELSNAKQK